MKIIPKLKSIAKKSTVLRIMMRNTRNLIRKFCYQLRGVPITVDERLLIFGAYNGKSYACSPKAVYEFMIQDDRFSDYEFIWIFDHPEEYKFLEKNKNTKLVMNQSKECERYLHQSKYWIFNYRILDYWVPAKNQVYIQCWHGTPLKRLGYDITHSDNAMNSVKEIQSKYKIDTKRLDYLLSPCTFVTEKFASAWNLKDFGKCEAILEIGYPRNDFLTNYSTDIIYSVKEKLGLEKCNKKIILYAPTWRDNQHDSESGYVYNNPVDFSFLQNQLGDEYVILFRAHYLVADNFDFGEYEGFVYDVSKFDDINQLYIISDLLITDYSSVFFDYAILERPMLFYMYDMEEYRDEMRGFYLDVSSLPGPILKTEEELVEAIAKVRFGPGEDKKIRAFNKTYNTRNDGRAAERLADMIINGSKDIVK